MIELKRKQQRWYSMPQAGMEPIGYRLDCAYEAMVS